MVACVSLFAAAQNNSGEAPIDSAPLKGITAEQIIQKFSANEDELKRIHSRYTFRQTIKVQTVEDGGVTGEYQLVSDYVFNARGERVEDVRYAPQNTLRSIALTKEDFEDLRNRRHFALNSTEVSQFTLYYIGRQKVDELDAYVFDVAPKTIEKGKRYFQGRIWVDTRDLVIVKTYGKTVPDMIEKNPKKRRKGKGVQENIFPKYTTYREQIDGKYWFPTYVHSDEMLHFTNSDVQVKTTIKYTDYKRNDGAQTAADSPAAHSGNVNPK
jgi:hypothetical protein